MSEDEEVVPETTSKPRRVVILLLALWLVTFAALAAIAWDAYLGSEEDIQTLAEQIDEACEKGDLGRGLDPKDPVNKGLSPEYEKVLCENAKEVIEENDPELQDDEIQEQEEQEPEIQDDEIQERENQEREDQEPEDQNPENQDGETQDGEDQEAEIQDDEIQEQEEQEPEIDNPEPDDPDPASPYDFVFTFTVPGDGLTIPDRTYTVTCNSGSGQCTVQES